MDGPSGRTGPEGPSCFSAWRPLEQSMRFEPVVNLKAAKAIDLASPQLVLTRAMEAIQ